MNFIDSGYMTTKEFAEKYGVSVRRIQYLIKQGRIPAEKIFGEFRIPLDAEYPRDARYSRDTSACYFRRRRPYI